MSQIEMQTLELMKEVDKLEVNLTKAKLEKKKINIEHHANVLEELKSKRSSAEKKLEELEKTKRKITGKSPRELLKYKIEYYRLFDYMQKALENLDDDLEKWRFEISDYSHKISRRKTIINGLEEEIKELEGKGEVYILTAEQCREVEMRTPAFDIKLLYGKDNPHQEDEYSYIEFKMPASVARVNYGGNTPYFCVNAGGPVNLPVPDVVVSVIVGTLMCKIKPVAGTGDQWSRNHYYVSDSPHPHVLAGGDACLGDFGEALYQAGKRLDLMQLVSIVSLFLSQVYDPDSAGSSWIRATPLKDKINYVRRPTWGNKKGLRNIINRGRTEKCAVYDGIFINEDRSVTVKDIYLVSLSNSVVAAEKNMGYRYLSERKRYDRNILLTEDEINGLDGLRFADDSSFVPEQQLLMEQYKQNKQEIIAEAWALNEKWEEAKERWRELEG